MEGEGEHLLAEAEKETDPISEEKEVALGVVGEAHTEVAFHRGNFKTLTRTPLASVVETYFRTHSQLALCFSFYAARKTLATPTPPPGPCSCHRDCSTAQGR